MYQHIRNTYILIFFSIKVLRVTAYQSVGDFEFVKCIWNGTRCVNLEKENLLPEYEEVISEWPGGHYALPMPVDGCPESSVKGWEEGYIDLTWQHSHVVVSWNQSAREFDHYTDKFEQFVDVTSVQVPEIQSLLLGPYSRYRVKLNFCFKIKRNGMLDVGIWPDGNYSIYRVESGCPVGFSSDIANITIGKVSHITYDGHLPEFKLHRSGHNSDYLEMRLCTRSRTNTTQLDRNLMTYNYPFVLLQSRTSQTGNDSLTYAFVSGMSVTEQTLFIYPTVAPSNITELLRFCYFRPKQEHTFSQFDTKFIPDGGRFVVQVDVINGELTLNYGSSVKRNIQMDSHQDIIMELLASDLSQSTKMEWKLLDFGKTLSVYAILIPVTTWPMKEELRCYYSNAQWDFLYFGAKICSHNVTYVGENPSSDYVYVESVVLVMKRLIESRYMAFVYGSENKLSTLLSTKIKVSVLATNLLSKSTSENSPCNTDLGMKDHGINDFQISASSSVKNFPVNSARPFLSSWCASINDTSPWLLIDLHRAMKVEGISIWNKEYVYEIINNGSIDKYILNIGVRSFSVSFGDSPDNLTMYNNQVFLLDALYPVEKTQTFMFHLPFTAQFVKIHLLQPLAANLSCLRFELHGCRKTGTKILECQTSMVIKRVPAIHNPSKRAERTFNNLTVNECNNLCINNTECSIVNYFFDGICLHYGPNFDKTWMLDSSKTKDMISSTKVCRSDFIETPYVAYSFKTLVNLHANNLVLTYVSLVKAEGILTSIGFPLNYGAGENYKWLISYGETEFIKLVFTNVNLNVYTDDDDVATFCQDKLLLNEEMNRFNKDADVHFDSYRIRSNYFVNDEDVFTVDSSYNGNIFVVESELSYMTLTFVSCHQPYSASIYKGNGFRVLISKSEIAACLSPENLAHLSGGRLEYCDKQRMVLSSMTYLNIPFAKRNETWIIYRKKGSLRIDIIEFDIKCNPDTIFVIAERFAVEKKFCNLNKPPSVIHTASSSITVYFTSEIEKSDDLFRLVYTNMYETYEKIEDVVTSKGADIPAIYQSILSESHLTDDIDTTTLSLKRFLVTGPRKNIPRLLFKVCSKTFGKCYSIFSYFGTWEHAGSDCWIRRQRLVSIRNADELKLIMYLLRNFKLLVGTDFEVFDSAFRHNNTDFYYTYIGLHRKGRKTVSNAFFWENRTPLTFSAWKTGEPSTGDCTRMGFYMANEDHTWETHSCLSKSAFYYICETSTSNTSKGLKDRQFSYDYKGNVNVTLSGYTCQRWDSQYPHKHAFNTDNHFPDTTVTETANFCRDPDGMFRLWCYTTDPKVEWDVCYVNDLNEDVSAMTYEGKLDRTSDGSKCVMSGSVNKAYCRHRTFPSRDMSNSESYLTCFVNKLFKFDFDFGLCDFIDTASDRCWFTHQSYAGAWNQTASGKPCERWDQFMSQDKFQDHQFPDKNLYETSNFCRDPSSNGFPWCYVKYPEKIWEICIVEYGNDVLGFNEGPFEPRSEYFECTNGKLVESFKHCNGVIDCEDASDETKCCDKAHPLLQRVQFSIVSGDINEVDTSLFYRCNNQELISFLALCDGVLDCQDASDEINCTIDNNICSKDHFMCGDGSCIHISLFCNFISECTDASDEACDYPSCSQEEFACENGQCIRDIKRCNAIEDCMDGTDENNCESCRPGTFHCDYVKCLPSRLQCDTYTDCEDGTDEISCDMNDITSCGEWWENGYRNSGKYKSLPDKQMTEVYCDFSFMDQRNELLTVFLNIDLMEWDSDTITYTTHLDEAPFDEVVEFFFYTNGQAKCTQEIVQSCIPSVQSASERDDPNNIHLYPYCYCLVVTVVIGWEIQISAVRYCNESEPMNVTDIGNMLLFTHRYTSFHRAIELKNGTINVDDINLKVGNITCKEPYMKSSDTIACGEGRHVYDASVRCVFDVDKVNKTIGCRYGSHLQTCDDDCPKGTVKCPGSYCIPLRFVCDGIEQCPNAEDEFGCGCEDTEREVIIIDEETDDKGPDIMALAKLLSSTNSIIRILKYKSTNLSDGIPFLHKVLQIKDKEVTPSEFLDRNYECEYKLLANLFLNSVRFTKQRGKSIVFIQNSPESELIAKLMFANITQTPNFTIYRVIQSSISTFRVQEFPFVIDITVKKWKLMSSLAPRYMPKVCKEAFTTSLPGSYKCSSSKMGISIDQVCDSHADCIHGDDELLCNFVCPDSCVCNGFVMTCTMSDLNSSDFSPFSKQTRSLTIRKVGEMEIYVIGNMLDFPLLYALNLSNCNISEFQANAFVKIRNLRMLDISNNVITRLFPMVFIGLQRLQTLILDGNKQLSTLEPFTFQYLKSLNSLRIAGTNIRSIVSNTFAGLSLKHLTLQNNKFQAIEEFGLGNLAVENIDFMSNEVLTFDKGMFTGLSALKSLRSPAFKYCCVRPSYVPEDDCFPHKDEFSSCEDLMRISILQTMLWLIGLCALLGNILSVIYRLIFDRERLKLGYGIFVTNLALADFFMGIYLIIIAVADAVFRNRYIFMDDYWRNSFWCQFAGVLSTMSSEASVMFLCLITLDRLLVIKYPFGQVRFDSKKALKFSLIVWILCLMISVFPLIYSSYFKNSFYNKTGVCIALPLTRDRPPGWIYSVLLFVVLNFVTFLLIAVGQWSIYTDIRKSGKALRKGQSARKKDLLVARNLLLVVATDFLCWFPIGCTGLMALSGQVISGDVYAWAAVFILPVNSALNPILYTLTAILGKKSFTPRTDEQSKERVHVARGKRFLVNKHVVTQRFFVDDTPCHASYCMLDDALQDSETIALNTMLKISHQLVETLLVLHKNSLKLGKIDEQSLYVKISQSKIAGDVQLRQEPSICGKPSDKSNDMYEFGLFLSALLHKRATLN